MRAHVADIVLVGKAPVIIVARPNGLANSLQGLIGYAKANPDTVRAFCRALLAAIADIRDTPAHEQLPLLRKRFTGVEDDMLVQTLENLKPIFRRDGRVTPDSLAKATKFLIDSGAIKSGAPWDAIASYEYVPK